MFHIFLFVAFGHILCDKFIVDDSLIDCLFFELDVSFCCTEYRNKVGVRIPRGFSAFELVLIQKEK